MRRTNRVSQYKSRTTERPDDATWCVKCRKIIGDYGGWLGAQCQCGIELTTKQGHSIGTRETLR